MLLRDQDVRHRDSTARKQTDVIIQAKGCERDIPVPAKITLRLAQHVAVRDW